MVLAGVPRGARCRTDPMRDTASYTWRRVEVLTRTEPVRTRDAVAGETPAAAATCASVGCSVMEHLAERAWKRSHVTNVSSLLIGSLQGVRPAVRTHSESAQLGAVVTVSG